MAARKTPDLTSYFSAAKQSMQLSEAEEEIQKLRAEVEELRKSGAAELEAQLAARTIASGRRSSFRSSRPNSTQPRTAQADIFTL
jgi:hypothetical protein